MDKAITTILTAIDDKHGKDTVQIDLKDAFTDHFIVTTGNTPAQTQAIYDEVERKMDEAGRTLTHTSGYREGSWIIMDYDDVVVHIFLPEQREYYNLEKLWQ